MPREEEIRWIPDAAIPDDVVLDGDGEPHPVGLENDWPDPAFELTDFDPEPAFTGLSGRAPAVTRPAFDVQIETEHVLHAAARHVERCRRQKERHGFEAAPPWAREPIHDARWCVIDLETTGTRPGWGDAILEIGALRVSGFDLGREFATLVDPMRPISPGAQAVHRIRDADVAGAPRLAAALPWLVEMARGCLLVFHNAPFDLGFIQTALRQHEREPFDLPVLDTVVLSRRLLGGRVGLGTAAARLGIEAPHVHRALPDARLTALLLVRLLEMLVRAGARQLFEIPGLERRPPRTRRGIAPPLDPLARRLERAIRDDEALVLAVRAARGVAPYEMRVLPLRLRGGMQLLAHDLDRDLDVVLDLRCVDRLAVAL